MLPWLLGWGLTPPGPASRTQIFIAPCLPVREKKASIYGTQLFLLVSWDL